jgi:hypothetical protein
VLDLITRAEGDSQLTITQQAELATFAARAEERYDKLRTQLTAADRIARRVARAADRTALETG